MLDWQSMVKHTRNLKLLIKTESKSKLVQEGRLLPRRLVLMGSTLLQVSPSILWWAPPTWRCWWVRLCDSRAKLTPSPPPHSCGPKINNLYLNTTGEGATVVLLALLSFTFMSPEPWVCLVAMCPICVAYQTHLNIIRVILLKYTHVTCIFYATHDLPNPPLVLSGLFPLSFSSSSVFHVPTKI